MNLQAQIDAIEARRLQRKGAVDFEDDADARRFEELQAEANAIVQRRGERLAKWMAECAKYDGQLELLHQMLKEANNGNNPTE